MTSAPKSPRIRAQRGPAKRDPSSSTRIPLRGGGRSPKGGIIVCYGAWKRILDTETYLCIRYLTIVRNMRVMGATTHLLHTPGDRAEDSENEVPRKPSQWCCCTLKVEARRTLLNLRKSALR